MLLLFATLFNVNDWNKQMSHYAKVEDGLVTKIIVAELEFFDTFVDLTPGEWIKTSYNTQSGVHILGGQPLRMNFAGIGFTYDSVKDAFIPPKVHNSWLLDEATCTWVAPVDYPSDGLDYSWDEPSLAWVEIVAEELT